jgi:hypothetical protein
MYRIAEASSRLRMMNGSLQVNVLGDGENVAMIALPLKKTISLASLKAKKQ